MVTALCIRKGCDRPRAQNPRTGEYHDHCSLKCMKLDQEEDEEGKILLSLLDDIVQLTHLLADLKREGGSFVFGQIFSLPYSLWEKLAQVIGIPPFELAPTRLGNLRSATSVS